ncbi:MAG: PaaX family transcriptional regulator, partial [Nocardioidaceae bacterium]
HLLRSRLSWLGFGTAAPGVWIAPGHLATETRDVLERHHLSSYVDLFRADYLAFGDVSEQVRRWWDLDELQRLYDEFLGAFGPMLARWRRRRVPDSASAFAAYLEALTAWRRLPFLDPGLPARVLPRQWHGARAAELFFELRERLADPAHSFVDSVRSTDPQGAPESHDRETL